MKLYYGNGKCSIEGGVENMAIILTYKGAVEIDDLTPEGYIISATDSKITIFFNKDTGIALGDLFNYVGMLKIIKVEAGDINGIIQTSIHRVMDYSELLNSNAEDMTTISEDLSSGYTADKKVAKTVLKQGIIPNLDTKERKSLLLPDGSVYSGAFHIHLLNGVFMTGAEHTDESVVLTVKLPQKRIKPMRAAEANAVVKKISPEEFGTIKLDTERISPQKGNRSGNRSGGGSGGRSGGGSGGGGY